MNPNFIFLILIHTIALTCWAEPGQYPKIEDADSIKRQVMQNWSRQLGVTCAYCHDVKNFKDPTKASYKVSIEHQRLVRLINEQVFIELDKSGAPKIKADCYMCHRGLAIPAYKEPRNNLSH